MLHRKIFIMFLVTSFLFLKPVFSQMTALNAKVSSMIRPNWEFEAFWAIPRVGDTKPIVSIFFSETENAGTVRCLNLEFLEIEKQFKPKVILEREFLHKIMCKSINRALEKTNGLRQVAMSIGLTEIGLRFDFLNGWIEIIEVPEPPSPEDEEPSSLGGLGHDHQQNT